MLNEKKSSILYVLEILKKYSDENHYLKYSDIISKLASNYGIEIERKTVARDIDILEDYGYDIHRHGKLGLYLGARDYESGELLYLLDAIYSSRSMPTKYVRELSEKLMKNYSIYQQKNLKHLEKISNDATIDNKQLFLTIETLNEAINKKKKVEFKYNSFGLDKKLSAKFEDKIYKINPYFMLNNHGKYYLVCNYDKYNDLSNYRIDYISEVKILDESIKGIETLDACKNFSLKNYINEHIYMTHGNSIEVKLKFDSKKFVNDFIDWFGCSVKIEEENDNILASAKVNEDALIYWALQYGEHVEILEPLATKDKYVDILQRIIKKYN
ncbi:MAG: WYL domain-containing protein [Clostridia bacterium]|nr:WYL domain-containing protein [Clostridia bacterium]